MRRLRIAVTILGLAATLWLRDLHYYYLDSIGLPPPVSGIKLVDLEAITRTLVNTASALLALAYVVSPAHSLAAGMLWAAADAILWLDPKLPVYTAAVVLTVYALWNLLGQTRGGEKFLPALLEIMPIATVIAVIGLLYILLDRLPGMLIAQRILQGDVALLAATLGSTAAWDFAAAIASLFLVGLMAPRIFTDILALLGGGRVARAIAKEEALEALDAEVRGSFEGLSSYLASLLASLLLAPLVRGLLRDLTYGLVGWIHWVLAEAIALLPLIAIFYIIKRLIYIMVTGRLDTTLRALSVMVAAAVLASILLSPNILVEALTGIPAGEMPESGLDALAMPETGLAIEYSLRRMDEIFSILIRLFWGG